MANSHVYAILLALSVFFLPLTRCSEELNIMWTPQSVQDIQNKITANIGDVVSFVCPIGSFSNIWYMTSEKQFENCDCRIDGPDCFLIGTCAYFNEARIPVHIKTNAESLGNSEQGYLPGRTYYFASFSRDLSSIQDFETNHGGECVSDMLKLELEILPVGNGTVVGGGDSNTDEEETGSGSLSGSNPDDAQNNPGDVITAPLEPSSSISNYCSPLHLSLLTSISLLISLVSCNNHWTW